MESNNENSNSLLSGNCTLCGSSNTEVLFIKNGYSILHCKNCNHVFTGHSLTNEEFENIYSDSYFFDGGVGYDDYTLQKDLLIRRGEYYADKISRYVSAGKLLDVGAAAGFILKGFINKGWAGTGLEPNATMAAYGRQTVGVNIIQGVLGQVDIRGKYDLIVVIQVISHIPDVKEAILEMSMLLNPGGHILIETWNKDSLTAKMFGKHWHQYSPPSIVNYFSKKTLKEMMSWYDFALIVQGTPKKRIYSGHLKSFITHKFAEKKGLKWIKGISALIPDDIMLPYPSEDLCWFLFKKIK